MAEGGWSGWWILGAMGLGIYAGNKLVPWYKRLEETEELLDIAARMQELTDEPVHYKEIQSVINEITDYQKGLKKKFSSNANDEDSEKKHKSVMSCIKNRIKSIKEKIPFCGSSASETD